MTARLRAILRRGCTRWFLRLAFTACVLTLVFTQVDLAAVSTALRLVDVRFLVPALLLFLAVRCVWAYQMWLGLGSMRTEFTILQLLKVILVSSFYSLILPGDVIAGGLASWYKLRRASARGVEALALLIYLRVVNTLTLLGIGLVGVSFDSRLSSPGLRAAIAVAFGGLVLVSLPMVSGAAARQVERVAGPAWRAISLPHRLRAALSRGWAALTAFNTIGTGGIALVFGLSLVSHAMGVGLYYLLALAVHIHLPVYTIGWIRSLVSLLQMIPISVAGLGVREASLVVVLGAYNVPQAQALGLSLVVFGCSVFWGIVGGLLEGADALLGLVRGRESVPASSASPATGGRIATVPPATGQQADLEESSGPALVPASACPGLRSASGDG